MLKKFFKFSLIGCIYSLSYAEGSVFQQMDNQIGLGYSYVNSNAYNPSNPFNKTTVTNSSNLNLHLEQLFDSNVWLAVDGSFAFSASQNYSGGYSYDTQSFGFPAGISAKGGYSFNWEDIGLQVIPYATLGRVLNYNGTALADSGFVNSFYNMYGGGARVEYVFIPGASVYFDQSIAYMQDPTGNYFNQSSISYTSTLGARYNVTKYFQLGLQGSINYMSMFNQSLGYDPLAHNYYNTDQLSYSGLINFAYLFDSDQSASNLDLNTYRNGLLANFDNSYSVGIGFANVTNSYAGGSNPNISSYVNYFNFGVSHLFDNNVWANINAQLINGINQSNVPPGRVNSNVPTYIGFPGSVTSNVGYAFGFSGADFQIIPYLNAGVIMSLNSYNVRQNGNLMNAISQDMYLQYGGGARLEYAFVDDWQIYGDQLLAQMQDRSPLSVNAWRSTSSLGINYNPVSRLQLGVKGFYDIITPEGSTNNPNYGYMALQQNSLGVQFDVGLRY